MGIERRVGAPGRVAVVLSALTATAACTPDTTVHLLPVALTASSEDASTSSPPPTPPDARAARPSLPDPPAPGSAAGADAGVPQDASPQEWALSFSGPYDTVEIPHSTALDIPQDYALEAWLFIRSFSGGHGIFNRWQDGLGDLQLSLGIPEPVHIEQVPNAPPVPFHTLLTWGFVQPDSWVTLVSPVQPESGRWTHLAVSYGSGSLKLYIDGNRVAEQASTARFNNPVARAFIGATARSETLLEEAQGERWWPPMDGLIADVRLSSIDRYPGDFTPAPRLANDVDTIALWPLNEGSGTIAYDSGRSGLHGQIRGASWIGVAPRGP